MDMKTQPAVCKAKLVNIWLRAEMSEAYSQPSHITADTIDLFTFLSLHTLDSSLHLLPSCLSRSTLGYEYRTRGSWHLKTSQLLF